MTGRFLLSLLFILAACSPAAAVPPTPTDSAPPANNPVELSSTGESPMQLKPASNEAYMLTATFHWTDDNTTTNIMYTYQIPFILQANGMLKATGEPLGFGLGDAGIRIENCVESRPVTMEFTFELQGRKMDISIDKVDPGILMTAPDLISDNKMTVFDIALVTPSFTSFVLEPFTSCMEEMDMEFAQILLTAWPTYIPGLPSPYHLIPAETGTYCTEPISFEEEGLGELTPCYTLARSR